MRPLRFAVIFVLLVGCAGQMRLRLADGTDLFSSRDTTFASLTATKTPEGGYTITISNYTGSATTPINAQNETIKTIFSGAANIAGEVAKGAVQGAK